MRQGVVAKDAKSIPFTIRLSEHNVSERQLDLALSYWRGTWAR
jgi:hypothetical protein